MSAETKAALDDALAAHIADEAEQEVIVTGYVGMVSFVASDMDPEATGYWSLYADHQPHHVAVGLSSLLVQQVDGNWEDDE